MRIGVNALYLIPGRVGGTEIYLRNVLQALAQVDGTNQYFVFRNRETGRDLIPEAANFHDCREAVSGSSRPARILYEQIALPVRASRLHLDVLFNAGFTAPLGCRCPMVTVFHDLQYERHPEYFRWFDLPFWRVLLPLSAARSRTIIALSAAVKADLQEFYGLPASRVEVIPHGIEPEFARIAERRQSKPQESSGLILTVSTLHPHKNLDSLLTAFHRFASGKAGWKLCIVGLLGFEAEKIAARRTELGLEDSVAITGWIPRAELYRLFGSADASIYPSRFEGFGIPVLEALASGIPTACSRLPSLEEIAGNSAFFFDPDQIDEMVAALEAITSDEGLRARLRESGTRRARDYSWEVSAKKLAAALVEAGVKS